MRAFLRLSLSLYHTLHRSLTLFITLPLHEVLGLIVFLVSLERVPPETAASAFALGLHYGLLLASESAS